MTAALLHFPGDRLATFICSFGSADVSAYDLVGTKGLVRMDPAYEYVGSLKQQISLNGKTKIREFPPRDQFAPRARLFLTVHSEKYRAGTKRLGGAHRRTDRTGPVSLYEERQAGHLAASREAAMAHHEASGPAVARLKAQTGEGEVAISL